MEARIQSNNFGTERAVRYQMLNKSYNYALHLHQYAELVIPLEGDLSITVDGRSEPLPVGRAAFVFPYQTHGYSSSVINRLAILVFAPSLIPDFFRQTAGKTGDGAVFSPSAATLAAFRERVFAPGDFSLLDVKGAIYLALGDFMKGATLRDSTKETELPGAIVGYINEHLTDAITLRDLARELGYHPNYLSGKIHEVFGLSLPSLIASIRADKAKYLLFETNKTGLEICYECGFGSERSFHRQFKAMTGRTPKEYRAGIHPGRIDRGVIKYF